MSEKAVKRVHRLCPCNRCDVEGIQSWLEDMAADGLFLTEDGEFCGIFTFERRSPRKVTYRLDVAQKRKPRFLDSGDELTEEELEIYRSMGWEYLLRYGDFRIYRSVDGDAPELNTEGETHAITISLLKKKHRSSFLNAILSVLFWLLCSHGFLRYGFRMAVEVGVVFTLCIYGFMLWAVIAPIASVFRFRRYEKRLLEGDGLNHRSEWRKAAPVSIGMRVLPILLCIGIAAGLLSALVRSEAEIPHAEYPGEPPFATVEDVFPDAAVTKNDNWDYGDYKIGETAIAKSVEWNESCDVTATSGETYFCILRLAYYETASEWIARGLERNCYIYDATRYRGKRFESFDAPDLGVDSVRVYSSYGTLCVLMREGDRVVYAVVSISNRSNNQNQWHLWAEAMAEKLK